MKKTQPAPATGALAAGCAAFLLLAACTATAAVTRLPSPEAAGNVTITPFLPVPPSPTPAVTKLWISPAAPASLRSRLQSAIEGTGGVVEVSTDGERSGLRLVPGGEGQIADWIYAVVAPFATVRDSIGLAELRSAWQGSDASGPPVLATPETIEVMRGVLGAPGANVHPAGVDTMVDEAWQTRPSLAIVPFEDLDVRWKVLELDGQSPVRRDFDPEGYPLRVTFGLEGQASLPESLRSALAAGEGSELPLSNRRSDRLTTVVMTGVSALTRATAWEMERNGVTFPARDIGDWLRQADITHVSHEVAFTPDCPPPKPDLTALVFCSQPSHIGLLEEVGTDVVELTGNHILDAGAPALLYTLDQYQQRGWKWFGGGSDLANAGLPVLIENNGNRIAFIGCNEAGPPGDWAKEGQPGSNPCGSDRMASQVRALRSEGYLPIFTFQWHEHYTPVPPANQREAFRAAVDAGAVAVSGSQAHQPQGFEFRQGAFIHYGLGNLFFDQMWSEAVRQEFIDRYVFHDGRLISVELLTAYLEDWSRPRPMTPEERAAFLQEIFAASGW